MSSRPQRKIFIRRRPRHAAAAARRILPRTDSKPEPKRHLPDPTDSNPDPKQQYQHSEDQTLEERFLSLANNWEINIKKLIKCNKGADTLTEDLRKQNQDNATIRKQLEQQIKQQQDLIRELRKLVGQLRDCQKQLFHCKKELHTCKQTDTLRQLVWGDGKRLGGGGTPASEQ